MRDMRRMTSLLNLSSPTGGKSPTRTHKRRMDKQMGKAQLQGSWDTTTIKVTTTAYFCSQTVACHFVERA